MGWTLLFFFFMSEQRNRPAEKIKIFVGFLGFSKKASYSSTETDRYDPGFVDSRYDFAAMVFETSGAVNLEGRSILKQIFRFASKRECVGNSVYAGRAWARLGCVIQYAVAQSILIRDVGVEE